MTDAELEERIDEWRATGEPIAIIVAGVALVGRVLDRRGALICFCAWGREAEWLPLADVDAAGAFSGCPLAERGWITDRQRRGLGAVELEGGA